MYIIYLLLRYVKHDCYLVWIIYVIFFLLFRAAYYILWFEVIAVNNTLGETLAALRKKKKLSQKELADMLAKKGIAVTNQAISKWESGSSLPNARQFLVLCDLLDVVDIPGVFMGKTDTGFLAGLNNKGRKKVYEYADLLRASGLYSGEDVPVHLTDIRSLPLYSMAVSAGTGQFLDSSDYELVAVGDDVPLSANYGVRVSGDSMEPEFKDGQIAWVHQQNTLNHGEIGVFLYDGNAYLKRLRARVSGVRLQSLNPNYPDIVVTDPMELRVLGKVVGKSQ